jgi:hypothetical protein
VTDSDIVKAFESLFKKLLNVKYELKITQKEFLALNRVDTLIKRQQEEIGRLCEEANHYQTLWCKAEEDAHNAKTEAIKEFATKLKRRCCKLTKYDEGGWDMHVYAVYVDDIDNLVEKMTEDENDG